MTEIISGCVYHKVTCVGPMRFKVEVYRDGCMVFGEDDDEPMFYGGRKVAVLYRRTEALANGAGIEYSFVTSREKFRGVIGPKYGRKVTA